MWQGVLISSRVGQRRERRGLSELNDLEAKQGSSGPPDDAKEGTLFQRNLEVVRGLDEGAVLTRCCGQRAGADGVD
jgi:hypothetical protein